jgi:hypothetical protein
MDFGLAFAEFIIGPRLPRTRWLRRPGMTK